MRTMVTELRVEGVPVPQGSLTAFVNPKVVLALGRKLLDGGFRRCLVGDGPMGSHDLARFAKAIQAAIVMPQSKKVKAWRQLVARQARAARADCLLPIEKGRPVGLVLWFTLPRPKSVRKTEPPPPDALAAKKPDLDKLERAVLDALTGIWFDDDSQVVDINSSKRVALPDESPGVRVFLYNGGRDNAQNGR